VAYPLRLWQRVGFLLSLTFLLAGFDLPFPEFPSGTSLETSSPRFFLTLNYLYVTMRNTWERVARPNVNSIGINTYKKCGL
jgi:hypothetical protein